MIQIHEVRSFTAMTRNHAESSVQFACQLRVVFGASKLRILWRARTLRRETWKWATSSADRVSSAENRYVCLH